MAGHSLISQCSPTSRQSGQKWERVAEIFLRSHGLKLLQRNYSSRFGEIDLIMEDKETIVFVEVKYRENSHHGSGADAVTYHKQHKISRTASWYLALNPDKAAQNCRFDVVSIDSRAKSPQVNWIKAAFYSTTG